jgi:hypothetical protein
MLITGRQSLEQLNPAEKRNLLSVLSDVVWDIEAELAMAKAERASLMSSLQGDMRGKVSF